MVVAFYKIAFGDHEIHHAVLEKAFAVTAAVQTDMFIWSLIQKIVRRLQFPNKWTFVRTRPIRPRKFENKLFVSWKLRALAN